MDWMLPVTIGFLLAIDMWARCCWIFLSTFWGTFIWKVLIYIFWCIKRRTKFLIEMVVNHKKCVTNGKFSFNKKSLILRFYIKIIKSKVLSISSISHMKNDIDITSLILNSKNHCNHYISNYNNQFLMS